MPSPTHMPNKASACAKIILFGEHAVVYGKPAIAVPVGSIRAFASIKPANTFQIYLPDIQTQLSGSVSDQKHPFMQLARQMAHYYQHPLPDLRIIITSDIPIASGLGSGAAISTTIARALAAHWRIRIDPEEMNEFVYQIENIFHGSSSGIDNTVIVHEKPVYYVKDEPIITLTNHTGFHLLVADSGIPAETHITVGAVRALYESDMKQTAQQLDDIADIVRNAKIAMQTGSWRTLGMLMNHNHNLLRKLTVSSDALDRLQETAIEHGAIGAKLSGGGRGGNIIALVETQNIESLSTALRKAGAKRIISTLVERSGFDGEKHDNSN
jgi:mevalonate kinase